MHTPGPWWIDDHGFIASGNGETYVTVADPHCNNQDIDEREANARLITAAPDLLDALRRVMRHIPADAGGASLSDDMYRARKAVDRATSKD